MEKPHGHRHWSMVGLKHGIFVLVALNAWSTVSAQTVSSGGERKLSVPRDRPVSERPFWETKPEWKRRIVDEREVVVSVRSDAIEKEQIRFTIKGAGHVNASKPFAFTAAQDYQKLKKVSSHFKTVDWHPETHKLLLITEALGWQARMVMDVRTASEDWRDEIQWNVTWGDFRGMKGVLAFEQVGDARTEVSIEAIYEAAKLPLPKFLMGFALEAVVRKVAEKMRTFIENEAKEAASSGKPTSASPPSDALDR